MSTFYDTMQWYNIYKNSRHQCLTCTVRFNFGVKIGADFLECRYYESLTLYVNVSSGGTK